MNLHLVGVLHDDPEGYDRTRDVLEKLEPRVVGVEWAGEEYDRFSGSFEVTLLRAKMDEAIKGVFKEMGVDPNLYERANEISASRTFGEIRAVRDYARGKNVVVVPTEDAKAKIDVETMFLHDISGARSLYKAWLTRLARSSQQYYPEVVNRFDPSEYDAFVAHLFGMRRPQDDQRWLDGYINSGVINPIRLGYQSRQVCDWIPALREDENFVHVGGLAHLIDDGRAETRGPVNLYQCLEDRFPGQVNRHSLREGSITD